MAVIYGIANCDKCRAAQRWFRDQSVDFRFHDFRRDGVDSTQLTRWLESVEPDALVNKRSTTWRQLSAAQRDCNSAAEWLALLLECPTLIKRPLVEINEHILVGYDETLWLDALA